jgi:hypothetical protein
LFPSVTFFGYKVNNNLFPSFDFIFKNLLTLVTRFRKVVIRKLIPCKFLSKGGEQMKAISNVELKEVIVDVEKLGDMNRENFLLAKGFLKGLVTQAELKPSKRKAN